MLRQEIVPAACAAPEPVPAKPSSLNANEDLEVPAYSLHPLDMELIRKAADKMNLSVVEYARLAPYLCARFMQEAGW